MNFPYKALNLEIFDNGHGRFLTPVCMFIICFGTLMLRNLDPVHFPILYGEDGGWTGILLNQGFWYTTFHARDFPVFGNVLMIEVSIDINKWLNGPNIVTLPTFFAYVSWSFWSMTAVLPIILFRKFLSLPTRLCLAFFTVIVPLGFENNEVLGRILNLGFIFPVIAAYIVVWSLIDPNSIRRQIICIFTLSVCVLTFPIIFSYLVLYIVALSFLLFFKNKSRPNLEKPSNLYRYIMPTLMLCMAAWLLSLFPDNALSGKGGVNDPFDRNELVEFIIARMFLFPIVAPEYGHLDNAWVVGLACAMVLLLTYLMAVILVKRIASLTPILAACGMYAGYVAGMAIQRSGLSALLHDYHGTGPDRYYSGITILSFFVIAMIFDIAARSPRFRLLLLFSPVVLLNLLINSSHLFEYEDPAAGWRQEGKFKTMFVREACPDTSIFINHPAYADVIPANRVGGPGRFVPIYPILQGDIKYGAAIFIPQNYFDYTVKALKIHCKSE